MTLFTLLVQGTTTGRLMRRLNVDARPEPVADWPFQDDTPD
jgi:hypothetical protein